MKVNDMNRKEMLFDRPFESIYFTLIKVYFITWGTEKEKLRTFTLLDGKKNSDYSSLI